MDLQEGWGDERTLYQMGEPKESIDRRGIEQHQIKGEDSLSTNCDYYFQFDEWIVHALAKGGRGMGGKWQRCYCVYRVDNTPHNRMTNHHHYSCTAIIITKFNWKIYIIIIILKVSLLFSSIWFWNRVHSLSPSSLRRISREFSFNSYPTQMNGRK